MTSKSCGLSGPAWQLPTMRLPLGRTWSVVTQASVMPGSSFWSMLQTTLPSGSTSSTRLLLPPAIRVLPFGSRMAPKTSVPCPSGPWPGDRGRPPRSSV